MDNHIDLNFTIDLLKEKLVAMQFVDPISIADNKLDLIIWDSRENDDKEHQISCCVTLEQAAALKGFGINVVQMVQNAALSELGNTISKDIIQLLEDMCKQNNNIGDVDSIDDIDFNGNNFITNLSVATLLHDTTDFVSADLMNTDTIHTPIYHIGKYKNSNIYVDSYKPVANNSIFSFTNNEKLIQMMYDPNDFIKWEIEPGMTSTTVKLSVKYILVRYELDTEKERQSVSYYTVKNGKM